MRKPANGYRFPWETMKREYIDKDLLIYGPDENRIVQIKVYLKDYQDSLRSVIDLDGRLGDLCLNALFGKGADVFDNPKPPQLLKRLIAFSGAPKALGRRLLCRLGHDGTSRTRGCAGRKLASTTFSSRWAITSKPS